MSQKRVDAIMVAFLSGIRDVGLAAGRDGTNRVGLWLEGLLFISGPRQLIKKVCKCKQTCSCNILFWNLCICFQPVGLNY